MALMIGFVLGASIYNIIIAFMMKTENVQSSIVFKVVPFIIGIGCLLYFLKEINFI
jgi:hypothetical protein